MYYLRILKIRSEQSLLQYLKIDVLLFSESIRLGSELTRVEVDDKVKLKEILRLSYLLTSQNLSGQKICFKNSKEFLVMDVVVELGKVKSVEMKDYQMNIIIQGYDRQDSSKSIIIPEHTLIGVLSI